MTDEIHECQDCGSRTEFVQVHLDPAPCPDSADGQCPEWFCITCGAGLLIRLDRVA